MSNMLNIVSFWFDGSSGPMESVKISTPSFIACNNTSFSVSTSGPVLCWVNFGQNRFLLYGGGGGGGGFLLDQWLQEHLLRFQQLDIWLYKQQF
ncbi:hypothetical protein Hanom_Chr15g01357761 [Helianthus anomalus]